MKKIISIVCISVLIFACSEDLYFPNNIASENVPSVENQREPEPGEIVKYPVNVASFGSLPADFNSSEEYDVRAITLGLNDRLPKNAGGLLINTDNISFNINEILNSPALKEAELLSLPVLFINSSNSSDGQVIVQKYAGSYIDKIKNHLVIKHGADSTEIIPVANNETEAVAKTMMSVNSMYEYLAGIEGSRVDGVPVTDDIQEEKVSNLRKTGNTGYESADQQDEMANTNGECKVTNEVSCKCSNENFEYTYTYQRFKNVPAPTTPMPTNVLIKKYSDFSKRARLLLDKDGYFNDGSITYFDILKPMRCFKAHKMFERKRKQWVIAPSKWLYNISDITRVSPGQAQITFRNTEIQSKDISYSSFQSVKNTTSITASLSLGPVGGEVGYSNWINKEKSKSRSFNTTNSFGLTNYSNPCAYACCTSLAYYQVRANRIKNEVTLWGWMDANIAGDVSYYDKASNKMKNWLALIQTLRFRISYYSAYAPKTIIRFGIPYTVLVIKPENKNCKPYACPFYTSGDCSKIKDK